jgi:xanthine dehydrogenase accessory factor
MFDILDTIDNWVKEGKAVALATVAETWGSAPRQAGAKMAVTADMAMVGSVSGGCVEGAVIQEAVDCLTDGRPRLLKFGVSDETAWDVGLACGGKIAVYVEPLDKVWWQAAARSVRENRAMATATILTGPSAGQKVYVDPVTGDTRESPGPSTEQCETLAEAALGALERRQSEHKLIGELDVLIEVHRPQPRLIMVGGAHVAIALQSFARQLGFQVVLVDPRQVFASHERFPELETILTSYPDKAFAQLGLDSETYITILTHDPKIDDPALRAALPSPAAYIGILSSMRSHQQRIERLTAAGIDPKLFERIHVPIGLEIGAKTPEEIALAIMAQIVAVRNGALK